LHLSIYSIFNDFCRLELKQKAAYYIFLIAVLNSILFSSVKAYFTLYPLSLACEKAKFIPATPALKKEEDISMSGDGADTVWLETESVQLVVKLSALKADPKIKASSRTSKLFAFYRYRSLSD
jgi:hypothetical protein